MVILLIRNKTIKNFKILESAANNVSDSLKMS